jgi:hypothetical protein
MSRQPDYALDALTEVTNTGEQGISFDHDGKSYELPMGVSEWPFEIAERIARKFGKRGVAITATPDRLSRRQAEKAKAAVIEAAVVEPVPEVVVEVEDTPQIPAEVPEVPETPEATPEAPEAAPQPEAESSATEEAESE